ncbi:hypothetical protein EW146_g1590 [Bondarzewia mesenterica]|uniref:Uncharacterized protein n=1 Tax=Bondarzewia mesenterica TaxID=1095465 RepID=A0A4S4M3T1_9AGAM|nr:hypothetical protein EW146_g1590 [Bondarzewia mesenterica]
MTEGDLSKWHSIRPWHPRLSLSVREITSVSATFILSSLSSQTNLSLLLDGDDDENDDDATTQSSSAHQIMSDALSVKVNGVSWKLFLIRVDDEADEALIIIYGLMPGRQYDIELGVLPGEERVKGQIVTESRSRDDEADGNQEIPQLSHLLNTSSHPIQVDPSPSPPSPSPPTTPTTPTHSHQTLEEYLASLQASLSHLQNEHNNLLSSLKAARRDAQKSQSALRSEISSLKRSSQKHSAGDARMRQKVRALEEAVKQAVKGKEDVEAEWKVVESDRKVKEVEVDERQRQWEVVKRLAEEGRREREEREGEDSARLQAVRVELAGVDARLDKLRSKQDKLVGKNTIEEDGEDEGPNEGEKEKTKEDEEPQDGSGIRGIVGDLEERLRELQLERERIEADPYGYLISTDGPSNVANASTDSNTSRTDRSSDPSPRFHNPHGRHNHNPSHNHYHHNPFAHRGKRHMPFAPHAHPHVHQHQQQHQHSHSHPYVHPRAHHPFVQTPAVPVNATRTAARWCPRVLSSHSQCSARRRHTISQVRGAFRSGGGEHLRATAARRSPGPLCRHSRPPFEPAAVRVYGKEGAGHRSSGGGVGWLGGPGTER